jgi:hypothetical protein
VLFAPKKCDDDPKTTPPGSSGYSWSLRLRRLRGFPPLLSTSSLLRLEGREGPLILPLRFDEGLVLLLLLGPVMPLPLLPLPLPRREEEEEVYDARALECVAIGCIADEDDEWWSLCLLGTYIIASSSYS